MPETINDKKIKILEIYEKLVEDKIWNEHIYLQEVNNIKNIKEKDLDDIIFYLEKEIKDDY